MWVKVCFVYSVAVVYLLLCLYFFYNFQVMLYSFLYSVILRLSPIISRSTQWMKIRTRVKSRSNPGRLGPLSTSCTNSKTCARPPSVRGQTSQSKWIVISLWLEWLLVFIWLVCLLIIYMIFLKTCIENFYVWKSEFVILYTVCFIY